jgi:hypothetical protein
MRDCCSRGKRHPHHVVSFTNCSQNFSNPWATQSKRALSPRPCPRPRTNAMLGVAGIEHHMNPRAVIIPLSLGTRTIIAPLNFGVGPCGSFNSMAWTRWECLQKNKVYTIPSTDGMTGLGRGGYGSIREQSHRPPPVIGEEGYVPGGSLHHIMKVMTCVRLTGCRTCSLTVSASTRALRAKSEHKVFVQIPNKGVSETRARPT